jgi:hypothetical protein
LLRSHCIRATGFPLADHNRSTRQKMTMHGCMGHVAPAAAAAAAATAAVAAAAAAAALHHSLGECVKVCVECCAWVIQQSCPNC